MKHDAAAWEKLLYVLEWILAVKVRHPDNLHFSLAYIGFGDKTILGNVYGANQAFQMLVDLARDLRAVLRKTDIVARNGTDFWVLIPHAAAESVVPKVARIVEVAAENGLDVVDRDISIFALPHIDILKDNGLHSPLLFLEYVKSNRAVAKSWAGARVPAGQDAAFM